jgi:ParB-like chromosome segregation protein Spo0J
MTNPTKDLMLFEEVDENFKRIIDAFGLNDNLFSKSKGSTYENLSQGLKHAYQTTVIPDAEEKAMSYSRRFNLLSKGEFLALDYSKIPALQENQKELAERLEKTANAVATLADRQLYSGDQLRAMVERINPQS